MAFIAPLSSVKFDTVTNDDILVPGSFVVLQGLPGDGMSNTIDSFPLLPQEGNHDEDDVGDDMEQSDAEEEDDDFQHLDLQEHTRLDTCKGDLVQQKQSQQQHQQQPIITSPGSSLIRTTLSAFSVQPIQTSSTAQSQSQPQSTATSPNEDSFIVVNDDHLTLTTNNAEPGTTQARPRSEAERRSIYTWNMQRRATELENRNDWLAAQSIHNNHSLRDRVWMQTDMWWLSDQHNGMLAVLESIPKRSLVNQTVQRHVVSSLAPGCTIVATQLACLDSITLHPVTVQNANSHSTAKESQTSRSVICHERGRVGRVQMLKIVSPCEGWVVLSLDGVPLLLPGLPGNYVDPNVWMWRVTCGAGAYVREGLELTNDNPITVLPYGSFFRVLRKRVNQMGLMRLRIRAIVKAENSCRPVEGWISEYLNPMSGQQGPIAQPLPFPVPALYKVILPRGAVIRSGIELSSRPLGHAPVGTILSVVGRAFSEHPQNKCIERLRLAGNGGWVSVRLCEEPPHDEPVLQLIGIDSSFDPFSPGDFHLDSQLRVEQQVADSSKEEQSAILQGFDEFQLEDLSEIGDSSDSSSRPMSLSTKSKQNKSRGVTRVRAPASVRTEVEFCLICLTEERTATIVHGETGHICCCLQCARLLKQRGDRCPVCRLPIQLVIQHFHV